MVVDGKTVNADSYVKQQRQQDMAKAGDTMYNGIRMPQAQATAYAAADKQKQPATTQTPIAQQTVTNRPNTRPGPVNI